MHDAETYNLANVEYVVPKAAAVHANNFYDSSIIFSNCIIIYRGPFTGPS